MLWENNFTLADHLDSRRRKTRCNGSDYIAKKKKRIIKQKKDKSHEMYLTAEYN